MTGFVVGYLTALSYHSSDGKKSLWTVRCVCGALKIMAATELSKLASRSVDASCGCMKRGTIGAKNTRHGMSAHPAYWVWRSMNDRCRLPTHQSWDRYGGRGITVCNRWQASFEAFWADMGPTYKPGLTLERVKNHQGYRPSNCRWATRKEQANNTRANLNVNGETASQLADRLGVKRSTMLYRLARGVPLARLGEAPNSGRKFSTS